MKTKPASELALHNAKAKGQVEVQHRQPSQSTMIAANKLDDAEAGDYKAPTITLGRLDSADGFAVRRFGLFLPLTALSLL